MLDALKVLVWAFKVGIGLEGPDLIRNPLKTAFLRGSDTVEPYPLIFCCFLQLSVNCLFMAGRSPRMVC